MNGAVFDELAARLSSRHEVLTYDLPGYGSRAGAEPYTLERLANDIAARAPAKCFVVGWSLGAQVALAWAQTKPQQIERLALIAATPCFTQRRDWPHAVAAPVLEAFARALQSDRSGTIQRFFSLQARGDNRAKRVARRLHGVFAGSPAPDARALERGLDLLLETDLRGALAAIEQPVLIVHGERDVLAPLAAGEYLAQALPHAHLEVIPGTAHAPFISEPEIVGRVALEFFDGR
jgi:pimeloyl-[acyl-carrier protein] methyl ester esterase